MIEQDYVRRLEEEIRHLRARLERLQRREDEINALRGSFSTYLDPRIDRIQGELVVAHRQLLAGSASVLPLEQSDHRPKLEINEGRRSELLKAFTEFLIERRPDSPFDPILTDGEVERAYGDQLRARRPPEVR